MREIDVDADEAAFDMERAAGILSSGLRGELNACFECCDRYASLNADAPALIYEDAGSSTVFTFGELQARAAGFAGLLTRLGIKRGDCVAALVPRSPELVVAALGTWRIGAIFMPLFTAFGTEAIGHRLQQGEASLLIVGDAYQQKVEGIETLAARVTLSASGCRSGGFQSWAELCAETRSSELVFIDVQSPFVRMFTSGTTGKPKSLDVPLKGLVSLGSYMQHGIKLTPEDRFWNLADPGWAYGLYYALIGPLLLGMPTLFNSQTFDAQTAIEIIRRRKITSLAGSPTAFRLLMAAGPDAVRPIRNQLRVVSSAGEPLTADVDSWFKEHLGVDIGDHYGQTELGMALVSQSTIESAGNSPAGGIALPGLRLVVLDEAGEEVGTGVAGELAVDREASPMFFFQGYREAPPASGRYYRTGDAVQWESDGSIGFISRIDDVITSSGYRIGPFDVESALVDHPTVVEAGVIGVPDPQRTEIVKAFVVLRAGIEPRDELIKDLQQHVRARLSAHAYPRQIEFVDSLPRTASGKLQRNLLKTR